MIALSSPNKKVIRALIAESVSLSAEQSELDFPNNPRLLSFLYHLAATRPIHQQ
jgi:hypothetical protein